MIITDELLLVI